MPEPDYESIERFFGGEMKGEELASFQRQLASDPDFHQTVNMYGTIHENMHRAAATREQENKLHATLKTLDKKHFAPANKVTPRQVPSIPLWKRWYSVAAAILILIIVGRLVFYPLFTTVPVTGQALYAQYAQHSSLSFQRGEHTNQTLVKAASAYNGKDYPLALYYFNQLPADSSDADILMAAAISRLETGDYKEALDGFDAVEKKFEVFKYQALWYKALALLKQNNIEACKNILRSLPAEADTYFKAQDLLKKLT